MDMTHIPSFGRMGYIHITIDTFSHYIHASARTGETVKDMIQHLIQCFQNMGLPSQIKTDNGPAYISKAFEQFYGQWEIAHMTKIPYNPQGQAIIKKNTSKFKITNKKITIL